MRHFLDFENQSQLLKVKFRMRHLTNENDINIAEEIGKLQSRMEKELKQTYQSLGPWEKVQVARHQIVRNYLKSLSRSQTIVPLAGDRNFAEDYAIIGGLAKFKGRDVVILGTDKGPPGRIEQF